jgi:hypothetical protein
MLDELSRLLERRRSDREPIAILVTGAAGTRTLATCAHAACVAGEEIHSRVRFTVLDRCRTPLELCRDFAATHKLDLRVDAVDLVETEDRYASDILVHQGLFGFFSSEGHAATLRKFASWLRPGGAILFSTSIRAPSQGQTEDARRLAGLRKLREMLDARLIDIKGSAEALFTELERYVEMRRPEETNFQSREELDRLFASAGVKCVSFQETQKIRSGSEQTITRNRVLAVLTDGGAVWPVNSQGRPRPGGR